MRLAEFLLDAIAEDEALAHRSSDAHLCDGYGRRLGSPDDLLAECEAKRLIVTAHAPANRLPALTAGCRRCRSSDDEADGEWTGPCETLRLMAVDYADRPGYNPWWEPTWLRGARIGITSSRPQAGASREA